MFERERCVSNITSSNNLLLNLYFEIFTFRLCRDRGPKLYIGPWALAEDGDWFED